ncbi:hypothetical protein, partial [Neobacillus niacini]|uniref:hypothetical protein n=1 Tax=Neobacillus niacini TaxID=86668 RepID=UPI001C8DADBA
NIDKLLAGLVEEGLVLNTALKLPLVLALFFNCTILIVVLIVQHKNDVCQFIRHFLCQLLKKYLKPEPFLPISCPFAVYSS